MPASYQIVNQRTRIRARSGASGFDAVAVSKGNSLARRAAWPVGQPGSWGRDWLVPGSMQADDPGQLPFTALVAPDGDILIGFGPALCGFGMIEELMVADEDGAVIMDRVYFEAAGDEAAVD